MYERHTQLRNEIENSINSGNYEVASQLVEKYELLAPKDLELVNYKSILKIYTGDFETAAKILEAAIIQYPINADVNYNMAYVYEQQGNLIKAYEYYVRASYIYKYNKELDKLAELGIDEKASNILKVITDVKENAGEDVIDILNKLADRINTNFGLCVKYFRDTTPCFGKDVWFSDSEKRFIAFQRSMPQFGIPESVRNLSFIKGELLSTEKKSLYIVDVLLDSDVFIPISTTNSETVIRISENGRFHDIRPNYANHFDYYRVKPGAIIQSSSDVHFGSPIAIKHCKNRKKLVLNIFIDGLSETILRGDGLKEVMPNTYNFFNKGIICTNVHSAAEWTYPSLISFISGLNIVNHMLYHNNLDGELRRDVTTLAQYFHEAGYYTAKIDGDWRSIPPYGQTRGVDRYIYQNNGFGLKAEQMIGEIIDHLEAFSETDRFLWVCFDDLHNIADGYSSPVGAQRSMELSDWEMDEVGATSAKQNFSAKKISRFIKGAKHLDALLGVIYRYILDNYSDDEILISLFADHGQGYLIKENGHFISPGRTNVAFMIRGGVTPQITDEMISACDYKHIMCELAGIKLKPELTDGQLPKVFGGQDEREWVMSESLHPGDPYYAVYYTKDKVFYFENGEKTQSDGRIKIKNYNITVEDYQGNILDDDSFSEKFKNILMDHISPLLIYED